MVGTLCESKYHLLTYSKTIGIDTLCETKPVTTKNLMW